LRGERAGEWSVWSTFSLLPAYGYPEPEDSPVAPYAGGPTGTGTSGIAPGTAINISALAISGQWISSSGRLYDLAQAGPRFVWSTADGAEHGSAVVTADGRIQVEQWSGTSGPVPVQGRVAGIDELGGATGIEWSNGVVFSRYTGQGAPPPAGGAPSGPAPREGYCCLNGIVYQARDIDCANYGGMFFEDLNAAQQACGR
jgi:hypothetical protein